MSKGVFRVLTWRLPLALLGIFILLWLMWPVPALAQVHKPLHAVLVRSNPPDGSVLVAPPGSVYLWFSEPVQTVGQSIIVLDPAGKRVEGGGVRVSGEELSVAIVARSRGTYLVIWQVISQDTDPAQGSLTFSVGQVSAVSAGNTGSFSAIGLLLQIAARWLHLIGYALSFGVLAFMLLVLHPLTLKLQGQGEQRLWWLIHLGVFALLLAEPLALLAQMVSLTGQVFVSDLLSDILSSTFGRVMAQRLGAAIFLWVLIGPIKQGSRVAHRIALAIGIALAFADSLASHALTAKVIWLRLQTPALSLAALAIWTVHMLAMGLWVGGLAALLSIWQLPELSSKRSETVHRFGRLAALALVWLMASGVMMSLLQLVRPADLFTTPYGEALLAKVVLLLMAMLLALLGMRAYRSHREWWWMLEIAALVSILVIAGLLVSLPPPI